MTDTTTDKGLVERLDRLGKCLPVAAEAAAAIGRLERERDEARAERDRVLAVARPRCAKCHGTGMERLAGHDRWATCEACDGKGY